MINKEIQMERFDAGDDMQEQLRQPKAEQAGPSRLEQLLNTQTLSADEATPRSLSEEKYPEAYRAGAEQHWQGKSNAQEDELSRLQAVAQEKIGYEDDTDKFFLEGAIDPRREALSPDQKLKVFGKTERPVSLESLNGPPLVFGGMLMGASLTIIALITMGKLEVANETNWYIITGIVAAVGLMYAAQLRN